ncbi:related to Putative amidase C550.07 [Saccharomycodes ludwigii]|uniref:amidase n=1 Tax=Saccharomycodes ludwigii TaxID=36035 RepID=A0A376B2I1_9ASCO|nr:hypothetical protein SCDLUD_003734 [Saccharomycodes ludwigii]KAH3900729.1 hypothetical protein SCDLUD_003734 [Saccharomycodes ludwigii]SSD58832.1 related to Putative amidase C550.07 [Saccharomycodes ludwigii]
MSFGKTLYATENPELFAKFTPLIEEYNKAREEQIKNYDPEFYAKCKDTVAPAEQLDSEPINALQYLEKLLTPSELVIVNEYSIKDLLDKQLDKKLTAVEIINAYIKAAIISQFSTNCGMQFLIPEALSKAKKLDEYLAEHGKLIGPFHGIPVSLKEQMNYAGKQTSASYVAYLKNIPKESGVTIQILDKLGANFHIRTAQPQAIMWLDTGNVITGRTRNPVSTRLSPGGSSGGESACVGSHGSCIGVGSDIGGSIRAPAAFANIFGLKPTTRRFSLMNGLSGGKGQESIVAVQGPLARSIEEMEYFTENYLNEGKPWEYDPLCVPIAWNTKVELPKKIRIGVLFDDNLVTPYPAVTRGMESVVEKLSKAGEDFEIVDLSKYWYSEKEMEEIYTMNIGLYTCDGNKVQLGMFGESGEPLEKLTRHFLNFDGGVERSVYENRMFNAKRDSLKVEMFNKFFKGLKLDFILSPTYCGPSEKQENSLYWGYTSFWNLLDYPNVIFPSGVVHDDKIDTIDKLAGPLKSNKYEAMVWKKDGKVIYDPKDYIGGPVALQLTAERFHDEDAVACVKKITKVLGIERR